MVPIHPSEAPVLFCWYGRKSPIVSFLKLSVAVGFPFWYQVLCEMHLIFSTSVSSTLVYSSTGIMWA